MTVTTATGTTFAIGGTRIAATDTSAEYAALTWVLVGEIESLGDFGDESASVNFTSVNDSRVRKLKGARDAGTIALTCGRDPLDVGQIAMRAAEATKFEYAFRVTAADKLDTNDTNSIYYFHGLVMSQRDSYGGADNVVKTTFNIGINTDIVYVPATVVP
jgi:hypothetical protein